MTVFVVAFSAKGCKTAKEIKNGLKGKQVRLFSKTTADCPGTEVIQESLSDWSGKAFKEADGIVFIGALGIAVRAIAPHVVSKTQDPAVICVDELGLYSIPVLSGHIGGGNDLASRIATAIGAKPVITTATDINGKFSVDSFATARKMHIGSMTVAKEVSAAVLDGRFVGLSSEYPLSGKIPKEIRPSKSGSLGIYITSDDSKSPFERTLHLIPKNHVLGIGCRKGTSKERISELVDSVLKTAGVSIKSVRCIASIDIKRDEPGLLAFAKEKRLPIEFYTSDTLNALPDIGFSKSEFVKSVTNVDCVCERAAIASSDEGELIVKKTGNSGATVALAREPFMVIFDDA